MIKAKPLLDIASLTTVALTFAAFVAAALTKGATEELLLEGGVFLVSVKLVLGNYRTHIALAEIQRDLAALRAEARSQSDAGSSATTI